jgi:hypothetical protein
MAPLLAIAMACSPDGPDGPGKHHTKILVDTDPYAGLEDTADTSPADSGTPLPTGTTPTVDCSLPLPASVTPREIDITTEEDFDFDLRGYILYQGGNDLVGEKPGGVFNVISPGISSDASGIQVLGSGDVIVASPDQGNIKYVYRDTGVNVLLVGGLSSPNGLEIGPGDILYFTELFGGRLRWIDPVTREGGTLDDTLDQPNGLAFSPDAHTLYVTANGGGASDGILKYTWDGTTWSNRELFLDGEGSFFDSVETDVCGNVYTVEFSTGKVFRISPDGQVRDILVDIPIAGSFAAVKWGNGVEYWQTSTLYVTNRNKIYAMDMGIQGTPDVLPDP